MTDPEKVAPTTLMMSLNDTIGDVIIPHEHALGRRAFQNFLGDALSPSFLNSVVGGFRGRKQPAPTVLATDAPARLIGVFDWSGAYFLEDVCVLRSEPFLEEGKDVLDSSGRDRQVIQAVGELDYFLERCSYPVLLNQEPGQKVHTKTESGKSALRNATDFLMAHAAPLALDAIACRNGWSSGNVNDRPFIGGRGLRYWRIACRTVGQVDILFVVN